MLLVELAQRFVLELTETQRLVSPLLLDFLPQIVPGVVHSLHDVLLTLDAGLHLRVEVPLQL